MSSVPKPIAPSPQTDALKIKLVETFKKTAINGYWKQIRTPALVAALIAIALGVGSFMSFKKGSAGLGSVLAGVDVLIIVAVGYWLWFVWGLVSVGIKAYEAAMLKKSA
jgi:hypothetical protein